MPHGKGKASYDMYGRSVTEPPKVSDPEEVLNAAQKPKRGKKANTTSKKNQSGRS